MSLTLVYIGAAAGAAPAASLRALSGGGAAALGCGPASPASAPLAAAPAVYVPAGLEGELRELVAEAADPGFGRLLELDPADGEGLDDLIRRSAAGEVVVALAGPGGPQLARELRSRASAASTAAASTAAIGPATGLQLVTIPAGQDFDDALLGQELVSLKRIVDVLRVECPWDREQTPRDIIGYTVEEVHELADAVAAGDLASEHGELGDLLLQVVLLSLMLEEEGAGDLASVAHDIEVKLIRRHPHIFADAVAETPKDVKSRWERIKVEQEGRQGIFHDVPAGFPALLYAKKLQQRAASVGFDWDSAAEAFPKIAEEHAELAELFEEAAEAQPAAAAEPGSAADTPPAARPPLAAPPPAPRRPARGARGRRPAVRHGQRGAPAARRPRARAPRGRQPVRAARHRRGRARRRRGARLVLAGPDRAGGVLPARQGGRSRHAAAHWLSRPPTPSSRRRPAHSSTQVVWGVLGGHCVSVDTMYLHLGPTPGGARETYLQRIYVKRGRERRHPLPLLARLAACVTVGQAAVSSSTSPMSRPPHSGHEMRSSSMSGRSSVFVNTVPQSSHV